MQLLIKILFAGLWQGVYFENPPQAHSGTCTLRKVARDGGTVEKENDGFSEITWSGTHPGSYFELFLK